MGEARRRGTFEQRKEEAIMNNRMKVNLSGTGGGQRQIMIDNSDLIESKCQACGGELFDLAYRHKTLPSISPKNPTGQNYPIKFEVFICRACGEEMKV